MTDNNFPEDLVNAITPQQGANPFDRIRQVDDDGNEYWLAIAVFKTVY
jgi:hypothetical protein